MLASLILAMSLAHADPCGMVPPIWTGNGPAPVGIERTGLQQTYMFHRDGVETIAIRPGFTGSVEEFGMLVPLPAVPALRKIDDRTFDHLANAIDLPIVRVHVVESRPRPVRRSTAKMAPSASADAAPAMELERDEVRVVKEEAVGMYEVAVLEAGSSRALERWMDENDFRYPDGMDDTVEDYVAARWMFVAIKTKVAGSSGVKPKPGMREVDDGLPSGASFDGYVQGMAFRFEVDEPVIPMRLAVFNGDDTHNRVYMVTESPSKLREVGPDVVRRQLRGKQLHANLTGPLPLEIIGPENKISEGDWQNINAQRSADSWVIAARGLVGSDMLAARTDTLSLPFEEREKELLRINEALNLRGAGIDQQVDAEVREHRAEAVEPGLADLFEMSMTVVDGDLPADVLRDENLHPVRYDLPSVKNRPEVWNVRPAGPQLWVYYGRGW